METMLNRYILRCISLMTFKMRFIQLLFINLMKNILIKTKNAIQNIKMFENFYKNIFKIYKKHQKYKETFFFFI